MALDVSVLQQSALSLEMSILQQWALPWMCIFYSSLRCPWTCLFYSSECCLGCVYSTAVFAVPGHVYSTADCAALGRVHPCSSPCGDLYKKYMSASRVFVLQLSTRACAYLGGGWAASFFCFFPIFFDLFRNGFVCFGCVDTDQSFGSNRIVFVCFEDNL
jgi:hypothetical protein